MPVYFDDLTVDHKSRVVQQLDYYPFGLLDRPEHGEGGEMAHSWEQLPNAVANPFRYNAGAEKNDQTGNYETLFRQYDPAIGRMLAVDPMAAKYSSVSPYNYAFNDPVYWNDPSGADPNDWNYTDEYIDQYQNDVIYRDHGPAYVEGHGNPALSMLNGISAMMNGGSQWHGERGAGLIDWGYAPGADFYVRRNELRRLVASSWDRTGNNSFSISKYSNGERTSFFSSDNYLVVGDGIGNGILQTFNKVELQDSFIFGQGQSSGNYNAGLSSTLMKEIMMESTLQQNIVACENCKTALDWAEAQARNATNVVLDLGSTISASVANGYGTALWRMGVTKKYPDYRPITFDSNWNFVSGDMIQESQTPERSAEIINNTASVVTDVIFWPNILSNKISDRILKQIIKNSIKEGVNQGTKPIKSN